MQIAHILDLFVRFKYRRGSTAKRLAREWGVSVGHVHNLACDARKKVREHVGDVDTIASEVIPGLMVAFRKAVESTNPKMNANVAGIAAQLLDLTGLKAAKKFEHAGAEGGPIQVQTGVLVLPEEEAT